MEMTGDLQGGQAMKQNPDDSRDLTSGAGTQQTGVLGLDDELADGGTETMLDIGRDIGAPHWVFGTRRYDLLADGRGRDDLAVAWPELLRVHYGRSFSLARRLAGLITVPGLLARLGPVGMRSRTLMTVALRVMGNLVTEEDHDVIARAWRAAGRVSVLADSRPPFR